MATNEQIMEALGVMTTQIALLEQKVDHLNNLRPEVSEALGGVAKVTACVDTMQKVWEERREAAKKREEAFAESVKNRIALLWGVLSAMVLSVVGLGIKALWGS